MIEPFGSITICNSELLFEYDTERGQYRLRWSYEQQVTSWHPTMAEMLREAAAIAAEGE